MKKILILLITINLYSNIEITQNIKALYKNVNLTEAQIEYIEDNQDINTKILADEIKTKINNKYLKDKNIVSFILLPDNTIKDIKFLKKADEKKINKIVKIAIKKSANKFIKPKEKIEIRFIIHYNIGEKKKKHNELINNSNKSYYKKIYNGTTRFEYSSKEYVRKFKTKEDGFINLTIKPYGCAEIRLLTMKNQKIYTNSLPYDFNKEIPKGKYKLLIKVKKTCDISLQYL